MNFKKLLIATSMLAAVSAPAHAVKLDKGNVVQLASGALATSTGAPTAVTPALELQDPSKLLKGDYLFVLGTNVTGGLFPGGQNIDVDVTLPTGMTFAAALTSNDVTSGLFATNATLQTGGAVGGNAAKFRVSIPAGGSDNITFRLNLATTTCPTGTTGKAGAHPGSLIVNAKFSDGTPVEGTGPATLPAQDLIVNTCAGFIKGKVSSDEATEDTFISLPSFKTIADKAAGGNAPTVVGNVVYTISTAHRKVTVGGTAIFPTYTPVLADQTDVTSVSHDLTFGDVSAFNLKPDTAGTAAVVGLALNDTAVTPAVDDNAAAPVGNVRTITSSGANKTTLLAAGGHHFVTQPSVGSTAAKSIAISAQPLSISASTIKFNDSNADFQPSEAGPTGSLDKLQRDGATFGAFDWNSESAAVNSIYRVTGLPKGPVTYSVELKNSMGGKNGFYTGTIPAADIVNGEVTVNSRNYFGLSRTGWDTEGTQAGMVGYKKADVVLTFNVPNLGVTATPVDVDRLIASKGGIVSSYGDGANVATAQGSSNDYDDGAAQTE